MRHADGHRNWIQVKLDLEPHGKAWEKLWTDLAQQRDHDLFGVEDRLVLVLGTTSPVAQILVDISERAQYGGPVEWLRRLNADQRALVMARERQPDIAVLFTSGYTENSIVHDGRLDAGVELLSKPYSLPDLTQRRAITAGR